MYRNGFLSFYCLLEKFVGAAEAGLLARCGTTQKDLAQTREPRARAGENVRPRAVAAGRGLRFAAQTA